MDHSPFDKRRYPVVSATQGYGEWAASYEETVAAGLDEPLLARVRAVDWAKTNAAVDLACGTGRTGAWLARNGVGAIDGVDATAGMLEIAKRKSIYRRLLCADVAATGLPASSYDLCTMSLADEHLGELAPVYREASRLLVPGAMFVLIGYHPFFLMNGMPTHYHRAGGEAVTIQSYVHLFSEHFDAARAAGLAPADFKECVIDEEWLKAKPKWRPFLHWPVSFALTWRRS